MSTTDDPKNPNLHRGASFEPEGQHDTYLVLSDDERAMGYVRPLRDSYHHDLCGTVTSMSRPIAETYARDPGFYGATYCTKCRCHPPVSEFRWLNHDGTISEERVGS